jgi:hypothetical protein
MRQSSFIVPGRNNSSLGSFTMPHRNHSGQGSLIEPHRNSSQSFIVTDGNNSDRRKCSLTAMPHSSGRRQQSSFMLPHQTNCQTTDPLHLRGEADNTKRRRRSSEDHQAAMDAATVINAISKIKSSRRLSLVAKSSASRSVYKQARWYTVGFLITYTFPTINRIVQDTTGVAYFPLMLLHVLFIPLQVS